MRPCIPQSSSTRPSPPFDCLHFEGPESGEPENTWDILNCAYASFTDRIADALGVGRTDFDEITRRLDRGALAMGRHVVDVMYELGDEEQAPEPVTLRAFAGLRGEGTAAHPPGLLEKVNRDRARRRQRPLAPGEWTTADLSEFARHLRRNPVDWDEVRRQPREGRAEPAGVLEHLFREGVRLVSPYPRGVENYLLVTRGKLDDVSQWWGGRKRAGNVYLVWYIPTEAERAAYREAVLKVIPDAKDPAGGPLWNIDLLGRDYYSVYRTKHYAAAAAREFGAREQRGSIIPSWPGELLQARAEQRGNPFEGAKDRLLSL